MGMGMNSDQVTRIWDFILQQKGAHQISELMGPGWLWKMRDQWSSAPAASLCLQSCGGFGEWLCSSWFFAGRAEGVGTVVSASRRIQKRVQNSIRWDQSLSNPKVNQICTRACLETGSASAKPVRRPSQVRCCSSTEQMPVHQGRITGSFFTLKPGSKHRQHGLTEVKYILTAAN
jgi:hypothetical protein